MHADRASVLSASRDLPRAERLSLTAELFAEACAADSESARTRALECVTVINMSVARSIAVRYGGKGIAPEDLEQVAYVALVRAVRQFDAARDRDFLSYAVPTINGELKKHFRDHGWTVRPPRRVQELQAQVADERARMRGHLGEAPSAEQIADRLGEPLEVIAEVLRADACFTPDSLDAPVGVDGVAVLGDMIIADDEDRHLEAAEARVILQPAVRLLPSRDRRILQLRYVGGFTQQEIADELGVTQMQVSRLLSRILRDMRSTLVDATEDLVGSR